LWNATSTLARFKREWQAIDAEWAASIIDRDRHRAALLKRYVDEGLTMGLNWYSEKAQGDRSARSRPFEVIHQDLEIRPFLLWASFLKQRKHQEMLAKPVLAAMFHTMRRESEAVRMFWKLVSAGVDVDGGSPESVECKLADFLYKANDPCTEWPDRISRHFSGHHKRLNERDIFATCLRAVRLFSEGRQVNEIFLPAKKRTVAELALDLYPLPSETPAA